MIFELICFGLFAFAMFVIFVLFFEGEDARKIRYYTDKMKRRKRQGVTIVNCTFDFTNNLNDDAAIRIIL